MNFAINRNRGSRLATYLIICNRIAFFLKRLLSRRLSGTVTAFAGTTGGFQDGPGASAQFSFPTGITTDGFALYVADTKNHRVRQIQPAADQVSNLAGDGTGGFQNGTGARFNFPFDITSDGSSLFIGDPVNERIRRIQ